MKICFTTEVTYPNYVNRIKKSSLAWFLDKKLNENGISYYISTNLPNQFDEYKNVPKIKVFDIENLRVNHQISKQYELFPKDPTGIYPSKYPWNMRRFIIEQAARDGFNYIIYIDADNVIQDNFDTTSIIRVLQNNFVPNTIQTNSTIFRFQNKTPHDVFEHHNKYIEHFNLSFEDNDYDTLDGPCQVFMGETNNNILNFIDNWHHFTNFGYQKEFGFGYGNNKHGVLSFVIPVSGFKLIWNNYPFHPHHNFEDRY